MLTYEEQVDKLNKRKAALEKRVIEETAEIEKITAKLNEMQLAKIRDALGVDQQELWSIINQHPEQLLQLVGNNSADNDDADDADTVSLGHQMSFTEKKNPYED